MPSGLFAALDAGASAPQSSGLLILLLQFPLRPPLLADLLRPGLLPGRRGYDRRSLALASSYVG